MSHLTSSPSQHSRPSASRIHPLQRPQHPISPPDTEVDTQVPLVHPTPSGSTPGDHSAAQYFPANNMESPAERFRRVSSLAYNNKGNRSIPKPTRWLVVVIPPVTLSADPSLLPALSSAPPARFSSGTLMPLYPTVRPCHFTYAVASYTQRCPSAIWPALRHRKRVRTSHDKRNFDVPPLRRWTSRHVATRYRRVMAVALGVILHPRRPRTECKSLIAPITDSWSCRVRYRHSQSVVVQQLGSPLETSVH